MDQNSLMAMNIGEILIAVLMAVAGGAAGAAVINGINERWKFKAGRKAAKEDREEEKADKTAELTKTIAGLQEDIKRLRSSDAAQSEALKQILLDRVLYLGQGYIAKGEISYDDRRRFHAMHDCYHKGLGGNGDADIIVEGVDALPLKK